MKILRFLMLVVALGEVSNFSQLNANCADVDKIFFRCVPLPGTRASKHYIYGDLPSHLERVNCTAPSGNCKPMNDPGNQKKIAEIKKWANSPAMTQEAKDYCEGGPQKKWTYNGGWTAHNDGFLMWRCEVKN